MSQRSRKKRLYSEKEMGLLIQRATEIQQQSSDAEEHGLSLDEIQRIASEVGIAPEHLQSAAAELEHRNTTGKPSTNFGLPVRVGQKRLIEGNVSDESWEEMVLRARDHFGNPGRTDSLGKTREWIHTLDEGLGHNRVAVSKRGDQSLVEVEKRFQGLSWIWLLLATIIGGTMTGVALDGSGFSDMVIYTLFTLGSLISLGLGKVSLSYWAERQQDKLESLLEEFVDFADLSDEADEREHVPASKLDIPEESSIEEDQVHQAHRTRS